MTIDEAIKHCLEVAEQNEKKAEYRPRMDYYDEIESRADCLEYAADHRQFAKWLTDYKELKNSVGAVKLEDMKEALELIREYKAENIAQKKNDSRVQATSEISDKRAKYVYTMR